MFRRHRKANESRIWSNQRALHDNDRTNKETIVHVVSPLMALLLMDVGVNPISINQGTYFGLIAVSTIQQTTDREMASMSRTVFHELVASDSLILGQAVIASTRLEPFFQLRKSRYALNHYFCAKPSHRSNNLKSVIYFTFIQSPRKGNKKHVPYWFSAASTLARQSKHGSNMRLPLET